MATRNLRLLRSLKPRDQPEKKEIDAYKLNKCQNYRMPDVEVKDEAQMQTHNDDQNFSKINMNRLSNKYDDKFEQMNYVLYNEKKVPEEKILGLARQESLQVLDKTGKRQEPSLVINNCQANSNHEDNHFNNKQMRIKRSVSQIMDVAKPRRYNIDEQEKFDFYGKKDTIFEVFKDKDKGYKKIDNRNYAPDIEYKNIEAMEKDRSLFEKKALDQDERNFAKSDFIRGQDQSMQDQAKNSFKKPVGRKYQNEDILEAHKRLYGELMKANSSVREYNHYDDIQNRNVFFKAKLPQNSNEHLPYLAVQNKPIPSREKSLNNDPRPYIANQYKGQISRENTVQSIGQSYPRKLTQSYDPEMHSNINHVKQTKTPSDKVSCHMGYSWNPNTQELIDSRVKQVKPIIQSTKNLLQNKSKFDCNGVFINKQDLLQGVSQDPDYRYGHGWKPREEQHGNFHRVHRNYFQN